MGIDYKLLYFRERERERERKKERLLERTPLMLPSDCTTTSAMIDLCFSWFQYRGYTFDSNSHSVRVHECVCLNFLYLYYCVSTHISFKILSIKGNTTIISNHMIPYTHTHTTHRYLISVHHITQTLHDKGILTHTLTHTLTQ